MFAIQKHKGSEWPIIPLQKKITSFFHVLVSARARLTPMHSVIVEDYLHPSQSGHWTVNPNFSVQILNRHHFVVILESIIAIWMKLAKIYRISKRVSCCPRANSFDRATLIWIMSINQCVWAWVPEGSVDCIYVRFLFVYKCVVYISRQIKR